MESYRDEFELLFYLEGEVDLLENRNFIVLVLLNIEKR